MTGRLVILDPVHIAAVQLGAASAVALGMHSGASACRSFDDCWTAALLVHEVANNPLWRVGNARPAGAVDVVMGAVRRLTDRAIAFLAEPTSERLAA